MRKLKNFIRGFIDYTEGKGSPEIYRLWTAIFIVGAVLERRVWVRTAKGKLYPNQYVLLVGGAGIGKTLCTGLAFDLLDGIRTPETPLHIAPTSVTKASLIDALAAAERRIIRPMEVPSVNAFNSLSVVSNEFGVFLPSWESEFMSTLTDLWDNRRYAETRRTARINLDLPNPQLNLFSATTPAYLTTLLPEGAWEQGFMSRILIVYSGEYLYTDLFDLAGMDERLYELLLSDLRDMYKLWGEMQITDEAKEAIGDWARAGGPPQPDHPKLQFYNSRRIAHLLKLCMISAVATNDELVITLDNYVEALDWLVELETFMPDVFKSMKAGGDGAAIEECWHFAYQVYIKDKKVIPEHRLYQFLQERVPAHNIERLIDVMCRAGLLEKKYTEAGKEGFVPKMRKPG